MATLLDARPDWDATNLPPRRRETVGGVTLAIALADTIVSFRKGKRIKQSPAARA